MAIFNKDIIDLAEKNTYWQKEVFRDTLCQIVLMNIPPGEDIGEETHDGDQTTFFVAGEGQVKIDGHSTKVSANHMVVVPKGSSHNIINKGEDALKLFQRLCASRRTGRRRLQDQGGGRSRRGGLTPRAVAAFQGRPEPDLAGGLGVADAGLEGGHGYSVAHHRARRRRRARGWAWRCRRTGRGPLAALPARR